MFFTGKGKPLNENAKFLLTLRQRKDILEASKFSVIVYEFA